MNQAIGPLPAALISGAGAVEGASLLPSFGAAEEKPSTEFDDLLDSEIAEQTPDEKKPKEAEPWTVYAFTVNVPPPPETAPILVAVSVEAGRSVLGESGGNPSQDIDLQSNKVEVPVKSDDESQENTSAGATPGKSLLEMVRPVEQKVPAGLTELASGGEQIAGKGPDPAKKTGGIPAAQRATMLFANDKQEKAAPRAGEPVLESAFEASAFESEARPLDQDREFKGKSHLERIDFSVHESSKPEWSSFEGISETGELEPARSVESLEVAQAIRTHVELLKTSGQGKLDVVLRPDAHTQLHLQVERVNGQILVHARCERGDFVRLEANWSAVQQTLANQGVRVEALQQAGAFNQQSFNGSFDSPGQQSHARPEQEHRFIEQELVVPNHSKKTSSPAGQARGWQSWA